jgi:hypothetical protein
LSPRTVRAQFRLELELNRKWSRNGHPPRIRVPSRPCRECEQRENATIRRRGIIHLAWNFSGGKKWRKNPAGVGSSRAFPPLFPELHRCTAAPLHS